MAYVLCPECGAKMGARSFDRAPSLAGRLIGYTCKACFQPVSSPILFEERVEPDDSEGEAEWAYDQNVEHPR